MVESKHIKSFRKIVIRYCSEHPFLLKLSKRKQNDKLYEAFGAETESEKNQIREAKVAYFDLLEASLGEGYKEKILDQKKTLNKGKKIKKAESGVFDRFALNPKKIDLWSLDDRDLVDIFVKFVGYIGHEDRNGYAVLDPDGEIHKGEALPEPIDDITGEYTGIQQYQADWILTYRDNSNILNIWGRGEGKTWKTSWIIQLGMKYECDKFLYFSLTDVAFIVANWVYIWAQNNDAIIDSDTVKVKKKVTGRKDSYQKFSLINGARMEIHGIRTASTLGYHGWIIIFDDIIDKSHKRLPHLQKDLETRWNSQYSKYRRKKFIMDNTRKFPGDFFDYIIEQFEKKGEAFKKRKGYLPDKYKLCIDLKTPYTELQYTGGIAGYRQFIDDMNKDKIPYNTNNILAPWYTSDDIEIMILEDWESFHAEMMGNPKALEGGMVKPSDLLFVKRPHFSEGVQMGGTGVDCASTEDENNDYTGIVSCLMAGVYDAEKKRTNKQFTFFKADIRRVLARNIEVENENDPFDWIDEKGRKIRRGIIETVQLHYEYWKREYPNKPYIVAWERNNAGIAIMEQGLRLFRNQEEIEIEKGNWVRCTFPGRLVEDPNQAIRLKKKKKANVRLGITHLKEKKTRIYSELQFPIKHKLVRFTYKLEESLLVAQLLSYPRGKHDDGPDAAGMIKDELNRRWTPRGLLMKPRQLIQEEKKIERLIEQHKLAGMPWMADKKRAAFRARLRRKRKILY